jgi:hypothetical protein
MVRRGSLRNSTPALLCAALVLALGCQSKFQKQVIVPRDAQLPRDLQISALFVYPFVFRWQEPAYRSFELSHRVIAVATSRAGDSVLLFGPPEFKVYRPDDAQSWAASDAVSLLPSVRIPPQNAAVLRASAERRMLSSEKELINAAGQTADATRSREITYLGRVELFHPSREGLIVEVRGAARADLLLADEVDPAPELTELMEALTAEALGLLASHLRPPATAKSWPWTFAFNPVAALSYAEDGRPALELKLAQMDVLEADAIRLSRVRYANPGTPAAVAGRLLRLPAGLWVTRAPAGGILDAGDLVTAVDGAPALPQVLQRSRFSAAPVVARVRKASGDFVEIKLP